MNMEGRVSFEAKDKRQQQFYCKGSACDTTKKFRGSAWDIKTLQGFLRKQSKKKKKTIKKVVIDQDQSLRLLSGY